MNSLVKFDYVLEWYRCRKVSELVLDYSKGQFLWLSNIASNVEPFLMLD